MIADSVTIPIFLDCRQRGHHVKIRSRLGFVFGILRLWMRLSRCLISTNAVFLRV